jgi:hypothetical protein
VVKTTDHTATALDGAGPASPAGRDEEDVVAMAAWRPGMAIEAALRQQTVTLRMPVVGRVTLPGRDHLIWYTVLAAFVAFEAIEWPAALLLAVAKALSDSTHHQVLRGFGEALEAGV